MKKLFILFLLASVSTFAQENFVWWNDIHQWDGHSTWVSYMKISTAFMGPNALPVPDVSKAENDSTMQFELAGDYHYNKGDHTRDIFTRAYVPMKNALIAFSIDYIPIEWYNTDTIVRDLRAARTRSGKGRANGDVYLTSYIQLFRDRKVIPDLSLRVAFRTASGNDLRDVRYSDGPGYYFDVSAGRTIKPAGDNFRVRFYAMTGFYVYQTFDLQHLQNDCFMYGGGVRLSYKKISLEEEVAGYNGYMSDGDKPMVWRNTLCFSERRINYKISFQKALHDFPSDRIRVGVVWKMRSKW